mmetsp:Transcript_11651/g.45342  ORF Transcript_11651/g.45342 Transcript_11651/m.45342 type:complete len:299 (-) Transcript_11651:752-1648(-)
MPRGNVARPLGHHSPQPGDPEVHVLVTEPLAGQHAVQRLAPDRLVGHLAHHCGKVRPRAGPVAPRRCERHQLGLRPSRSRGAVSPQDLDPGPLRLRLPAPPVGGPGSHAPGRGEGTPRVPTHLPLAELRVALRAVEPGGQRLAPGTAPGRARGATPSAGIARALALIVVVRRRQQVDVRVAPAVVRLGHGSSCRRHAPSLQGLAARIHFLARTLLALVPVPVFVACHVVHLTQRKGCVPEGRGPVSDGGSCAHAVRPRPHQQRVSSGRGPQPCGTGGCSRQRCLQSGGGCWRRRAPSR